MYFVIRTYSVQLHKIANNWLSRYLAFVHASVGRLHPFDVQRPFVGVTMISRLKTLIRCEGVRSDRKDEQVTVPNPRYLQRKRKIEYSSMFDQRRKSATKIGDEIDLMDETWICNQMSQTGYILP